MAERLLLRCDPRHREVRLPISLGSLLPTQRLAAHRTRLPALPTILRVVLARELLYRFLDPYLLNPRSIVRIALDEIRQYSLLLCIPGFAGHVLPPRYGQQTARFEEDVYLRDALFCHHYSVDDGAQHSERRWCY